MNLKILSFILLFTNCGYIEQNNIGIGQVKKIIKNTPIICPDYKVVNIAFGSLESGIISNTNDYYVIDDKQQEILEKAQYNQKIIKFVYNVKRVAICKQTKNIITDIVVN